MTKKMLEYEFGHWKDSDGNYFKETTKDGKLILKQIDKSKFESKIEVAREIADQLQDDLDGEKILTEAIMKLTDAKLERLRNATFKNYNRVTRSHHCVDMKVGNFILPIVD